MMTYPRSVRRVATAMGLCAFAGCNSGNVIGPDNQLEVANATDSFQAQATALEDITQTLTYTWQNTGVMADINQSGTVTDGTAMLVVRDNAGTEVYSRSLAETGTFATSIGESGDWTIVVTMEHMYGALNFRLQKP